MCFLICSRSLTRQGRVGKSSVQSHSPDKNKSHQGLDITKGQWFLEWDLRNVYYTTYNNL